MRQHRILKIFRIAVAICLLAGSGGIQAAGNQGAKPVAMHNGYEVAPGEVLVKYRDSLIAGEAALEMDSDHDEEIGGMATHRVHSRRYDTATLLAMLAKRADVEYAEPNYIVHGFQVTPTDTDFSLLWGVSNTGQTIQSSAATGGTVAVVGTSGADIGATQAWMTTQGDRRNVVAVIDTGIDYTHQDLGALTGSNVWSAPADFTVTLGGTTITCLKGTHGFNAIKKSCDPMDDNGHGTHVSGTIGAVGNNTLGVVGVNWTASIMGVKFLDKNGSGFLSDAINAIEFAFQMKTKFDLSGGGANVRVLSNSWGGGGYSQALSDEIAKTYKQDMLFVAAAGNAGTNNDVTASYPSSYPNVVAVAATDNKDELAWFSNYGPTTVALGAPGVYILSTYPLNKYVYLSGTSMAAPHVSGVAALVLAACGNINVASLADTMLFNTDPLPSLAGKISTGGRLNAAKAVTNCATTTPPPPPPPPSADFSIAASPSSAGVTRGSSVNLTVTTAATAGSPGSVSFTVGGLPYRTTASFSPNPATVGAKSTMTVRTNSRTPRGTYKLTITGTSGSLAHTATVTLTVN